MKKFNWGWGIVLTLAAFVLFIFGFIFLMMQERVDLVKEDYYEAEADYPELKRRRENTLQLQNSLDLHLQNNLYLLTLPKELVGKINQGELHFYAPTNSRLDKKIPWAPNENGIQAFPIELLSPGKYVLKCNTADAGGYYFEKELIVP